jgi:hypothetical protein
VALVSIAAVAWYDLVKIPAQQRYITGRNLRLLRTKSAQIKSKVDNFGISIDNALHFYPVSDPAKYTEELQRYMRKFAPSVEILSDQESESARANDRERVFVQSDAGRNFLYLTFRHDGRLIVARTDIEQAVAAFLNSGSEFDTLLLAKRDGRVIAQSAPGLGLTELNGLRESVTPVKSLGDEKGPAPPSVFERLRTSTNVENVTVGNAEYQMYVQPIQLSFATNDGEEDGQEEWALCGLVRGDHFRAAGSAISYTYLLWFGLAPLIVVLAIPLLKLHMLSPSERLRRADGVFVAATTFLATALLTFGAIDAYYFRVEVNERTRRELRTVAHDISERFKAEATAIAAQMKDLREPAVWEALGYQSAVTGEPFALGTFAMKSIGPNDHPATIRIDGNDYFCNPDWACRDNVLAHPSLAAAKYPYFDNVLWLDNAGWQRIKWSSGRVTPLLNMRRQPYFQQLALSRIGSRAGGSGIAVAQSRNSGEVLTIFWNALARDDEPRNPHLAGQAMVVTPLSLVNPVLPASVQFAVIDQAGLVLFHSDATRSLRENFFVECEENALLRSAVSGRRSAHLDASYLARSHAMYVMPLELSSFGDPHWSLVIFSDRTVMETVNLETLAASLLLFGIYSGFLAIAWVMLSALCPLLLQKWFWPDPSARRAYFGVVAVNAALVSLFLGRITHFEPAPMLVATALVVSVAFVSTFLLVTRKKVATRQFAEWETAFHLARVSFLFAVAAVPAIACFLVAFNFQMTVVDKQNRAAVAALLAARNGRIKARAARLPMCAPDQNVNAAEHCRAFIASRKAGGDVRRPWDVATSADTEATTSRASRIVVNQLDALLASVHVPYNDTAVAFAAALPPRRDERHDNIGWPEQPWRESPAPARVLQARVTWPAWLIAAGILGVLYALLRLVVRPLYLVNLHGIHAMRAVEVTLDPSSHALLVGPPGAGKSTTLGAQKSIRIFDARMRAFVEQVTIAPPLPVARRRSVFAQFGLLRSQPDREPDLFETTNREIGATNWLDVSQLPAERTVPIGIDHLEHSLDDADDRLKMLRLLESLIYQHKRTVYVAAARDPIAQLRELTERRPDGGEMARWIRVFCLFHQQDIALEPGNGCEQQARAIWASCSTSEQLALRQLADEDLVNPHSEAVVAQLMRRGLVRHDRRLQIVDGPFRRFVMQVMPADEVSRREGAGVSLPWASKAAVGVTVAVGIATALVLTSQQMVDAWIGYMPALAPAVPTMLKFFASVRDPKSAIENA